MGGLFGVVSREDCVAQLFYGTDYHSHLGTVRGGMAIYDGARFVRSIRDISNTQFRAKFEDEIGSMAGKLGIGVISDTHLDEYADPDSDCYHSTVDHIGEQLGLTTLRYQRLPDMIEAIGMPRDRVCTYYWSGEEL